MVTVASGNEPPVWRFIGDAVAVVAQRLQMTIRADDLDQEPLAFAVAGLPPTAVLTPGPVYGTALLDWTPTIADLGLHNVGFSVTDAGGQAGTPLSDVQTISLVVRNGNIAPELKPVGNRSSVEGELLTIALVASDANGDAVHFLADELPPNAAFDQARGVFTWQTGPYHAGSHAVTFTATDGHRSASETITIAVADTNQTPEFVLLPRQVGREGSEVRFRVVADDPDGEPLIYSILADMPRGAGFNRGSGELFWVPGWDQAGDYLVTFTAQDPRGAAAQLDVRVQIADLNRPPVLTASTRTFVLGKTGHFAVQATDEDQGAVLSFSADGLPAGATLDPGTGEITWTPGPAQAGEYLVRLHVSDGEITSSQEVLFLATSQPAPPSVVIELTPSFPVSPGSPVLAHVLAESVGNIAGLTLTVDGSEFVLDQRGRTTIVWPAPGVVELVATAIDVDGLVGTTTRELKIRDSADREPPRAEFAESTKNAVFSRPAPILGAVADANLDFWRLELSPLSGLQATTLASGRSEFAGALLPDFDPAVWPNGFYTLRLVAADVGGRRTTVVTTMEVNTSAKPAEYRRVEQDLAVDLGGVPYALQRVYRSLDSNIEGDFGIGWSLAGRDAQLMTNVPSTGREHLGIYGALRAETRVFVTLPDGQRAGFTFAPAEEMINGQTFYHPAWTADGSHGWRPGVLRRPCSASPAASTSRLVRARHIIRQVEHSGRPHSAFPPRTAHV